MYPVFFLNVLGDFDLVGFVGEAVEISMLHAEVLL
jgi:hypothetical protein